MPYAFGDYILTCGEITCQSFGLDRKKTVRKRSFFLAPPAGLEPSVIFAAPARQTSNLLAHLTWAFRKRNRKVRPCSRFAGAEVERTFGLSGEKEPKKSPRRLPRAFFGSPCWARTSDTLINSQVLVPTELRRNGSVISKETN